MGILQREIEKAVAILTINWGKCPGGKESTIVDITREAPVILRQGIIPSHEIDKAYKEYLEVK